MTAAVLAAAGALRGPAAEAELRIAPSVDPDVARGAFAAAAAGTMLQGATIHLRIVGDELACLDCARRYPGARLTPCPACGGDGLVVSAAPEAEVLVPGTPPACPQGMIT